jgi:hypothetical protein
MMRDLNIVSSYTTNECYQNMLASIGIESHLVPVSSNIPIAGSSNFSSSDRSPLPEVINSWPGPILTIFGNQVGKVSKIKVIQVLDVVSFPREPIFVLVLGNQSNNSKALVEEILSYMPESTRLHYSGYLDEHSISVLLARIHCCLTTYPYELAGKSTAIAAILDHGKQVFFVGVDVDKNPILRQLDGSQHCVSYRVDQAARQIENAVLMRATL